MVSEEKIDKIISDVDNNVYSNIHSIIINQSGKTLLEKYMAGQDYTWGKIDLGVVTHSETTLHDTRSISKSIVSACIGIAIDEALIKSADQNIFDFFPEYIKYKQGLKEQLTLNHLLTMTDGLSWDESNTPISGSENEMESSEDKIEFILSRESKYKPGQRWNYNSGATELLAQVILRTTGKNIHEYAKEKLFDPLEITYHEWAKYQNIDLPAGASGLRLSAPDLLKIGLLFLNNGQYDSNQIIPKAWIKNSLKTSILKEVYQEIKSGYGYQFWTWEQPTNDRSFHIAVAHGLGDQKIYIDQENEIVIVVTSGNYYESNSHWKSIGIVNTIYE